MLLYNYWNCMYTLVCPIPLPFSDNNVDYFNYFKRWQTNLIKVECEKAHQKNLNFSPAIWPDGLTLEILFFAVHLWYIHLINQVFLSGFCF